VPENLVLSWWRAQQRLNKPMEDFLIDQFVKLLFKNVSREELTED
jgi:hypothetical protein